MASKSSRFTLLRARSWSKFRTMIVVSRSLVTVLPRACILRTKDCLVGRSKFFSSMWMHRHVESFFFFFFRWKPLSTGVELKAINITKVTDGTNSGLGAGLGNTEYSITAYPGICAADQDCWGNPRGQVHQWFYTSDTSYRASVMYGGKFGTFSMSLRAPQMPTME